MFPLQQNHGTNTKKVESFCFPGLKSIVNCRDYGMLIKLTFSKSVENLRLRSNNLVKNNNGNECLHNYHITLYNKS